jgi:cyclic pyranopterin phosphate synthase
MDDVLGGMPRVEHETIPVSKSLGRVLAADLQSRLDNPPFNKAAMDGYAVRAAGLQRLSVSLDTLNHAKYRQMTRGGDLRSVTDGIQAAQTAGFKEIKLNCVVEHSLAEIDARAVGTFGREHGIEVRFFRRMDLAQGAFWMVDDGSGGVCRNASFRQVGG